MAWNPKFSIAKLATPVRGHPVPWGDMQKISVNFDTETFNAIARRAHRDKVSFGGMVRLLVEWGLEDALVNDSAEKRTEKDADIGR